MSKAKNGTSEAPPKRPPTSYFRFVQDRKDEIKGQSNYTSKMKALWSGLDPKIKNDYSERFQ